MAADLAHAHAARIHGDDLVVEIGKTALIFGDQLWIEGASPIPRNRQGHLRRARQYRLLRGAIATIGVAPAFTLALKVLVKFGAQNALRQRLLQIVDETARGKNLGRIAARQKPVQQFFLNSHVMSLLSIIMASSTKFLTVPLRIRHIRTRPYTPKTNGKAERFIQTMKRRWAYKFVFKTSAHRAASLRPWVTHYNHQRPHRSLGKKTPMQRLRETRQQAA